MATPSSTAEACDAHDQSWNQTECWRGRRLALFACHLVAPLVGISGVALFAVNQPGVAVHTDVLGWVSLWSGLLIVSIGDRVIDRRLPLPAFARQVMWCVLILIMAVLAGVWWCLEDNRRWIIAILAVMALAYPLMQRCVGLKTIVTAIAWVAAALLLPVVPPAQSEGILLVITTPPSIWAPLICLVAYAALLCDVKDQQRDQGAVRSLLVSTGWRGQIIAYGILSAVTLAFCLPSDRLAGKLCLLGLWGMSCAPQLLRRPLVAPVLIDLWLVTLALPI